MGDIIFFLYFCTRIVKRDEKVAMKRIIYPVVLLLVTLLYTSCESYETYGDKKERERDAINLFIAKQGIQVIDEAQFKAQNNTTDISKNQFVRFDRNGVYMQIVRQGCGDKLEENVQVNVLCRFMEKNIMTDSVLIRNDQDAWLTQNGITYNVANFLDKMSVKRTGTTITASFVTGMMLNMHGATVPAGWLVPLNYVYIGRPNPSHRPPFPGHCRCVGQCLSLLLRNYL